MSNLSREEAKRKLFEVSPAIGVSRNDLMALICERQELVDKFAIGFARTLAATNLSDSAIPAAAYDLAEACMRERAKRYGKK